MLIIIVLARLLGPSEFGIVTMAFVVTSAMVLLVDLGVDDILVRRHPQDQTDYDSAFWMSLGFSLVLAAAVAAAARPLAEAISQPRLPVLLWIVASTLPLSAIELVMGARMRAEMKFKPLAVRTLVSTACGGVVGIAMAFCGAGYWSLLAKGLVESAVNVTLMWRSCTYRPGLQFSFARWLELFASGRHLLVSRMLELTIQRFDAFLVSARLGTVSLALYSSSQRIYGAFMDMLFTTVNRVTLPAFGRMGKDHGRVRDAFLRVVGFTSFFTFPIFASLAVMSEPLVVTLLGPAWRDGGAVLAALCAGGVLFSVSHFNAPVLTATGHTRLLFRFMLANAAITVTALMIGARWGVVGVAVAYAARVCALLPLNLWLLHIAIGLSPRRWLATIGPSLIATMVSTGLLAMVQSLLPAGMPQPVRLLLLAAMFLLLHALAAITLSPARVIAVLDEATRLAPALRHVSAGVQRWHDAMRRVPRRAA
jgi:PST family polysaccharide transporter